MLSFFRRLINSKAGIVVTFVALGIIALAFAAGDVTGIRNGGGVGGGSNVAKIGDARLSAADLSTRITGALENARQQQPSLTMTDLLAQGGFEAVLTQLTSAMALEEFGRDQGMVASKRAVDGVIAGMPGLQGPTGKFDPTIYQGLLAQRHLSDAQVRGDISRDMIGQQLVAPTVGAGQVPDQLALPYASLLLERRQGQVGLVPTAAMTAGAAPTDAELQVFYRRNVARYTVPERRVIRYALVTAAEIKAKSAPTNAEVAQAYQQQRARFAAAEKRDVTQIVAGDQAAATALAAKIKGGTPAAAAARTAGLEASVQKAVDKPAYAAASSPSLADAVFAAAAGATVGPVRGPLGWTIVHVDAVTQVGAKTLDQARGELVPALTEQKARATLGSLHDAVDDALSNNATFDEVVADRKLTALSTRPVLTSGVDPDNPTAKPLPALAQIAAAGFQSSEGDAPQLAPIGTDGSFALVGVGRVVPAAPRPLAQVHDQVARDFTADRARTAARALAGQILAKVNAGTPIAAAFAASGRALPPVRPLGPITRAQVAMNPRGTPPQVALLFGMAPGTTRLIEAPGGAGWLVVRLDAIVPGNAAGQPLVIAAAKRDLAGGVGREYVEQFAKAVRAEVGVKTDAAAIAKVKAQLAGNGGTGN